MTKKKYSKNDVEILLELQTYKSTHMLVVDTYKYNLLSKLIEEHFSLICGDLNMDITGEQMFKECKCKKYKISLGYGEWWPFGILSETEKSNELIEEIFEWLQTIDIPK